MKTAERVVIVLILLILIGASAWLYFSVAHLDVATSNEPEREREAVAEPMSIGDEMPADQSDWRRYYPVTTPITVAGVPVLASVAETVPERIQGLSNTPYLPDNVVKLFVFGTAGAHSIWMKDMRYPLDILWAKQDGEIVHIEENVSPDTFPQSFSSPIPAWYVIEANAGFVAEHGIVLGDTMTRVE